MEIKKLNVNYIKTFMAKDFVKSSYKLVMYFQYLQNVFFLFQLPLSDQDGPMEPSYHSVFDLLDAQELAQQLFAFHTQLFEATDEMELIIQVVINSVSLMRLIKTESNSY